MAESLPVSAVKAKADGALHDIPASIAAIAKKCDFFTLASIVIQ